MKFASLAVLLTLVISPAFAQSVISFDVDTTEFVPGEIVELKGTVGAGLEGQPVAVEINDSDGKVILIRTVTSDINGEFVIKFKVPDNVEPGELDIVTNVELDGQSFSETKQVEATETPESSSDPVCGTGTILKDGMCVVDKSQQIQKTTEEKSSKGGGCLIATATYGSELAPQVQKLRELRDNQLLGTESGTNFINSFNHVYYTFSPHVADYERENPIFKELVKASITPMLSTLSIMEYAESESEVLGIGIGVILMNVGMYFGIPAIVIIGIKRKF
ncbi:hypothetical protein SCCGRSA3_01039 [Marine Group I thaumarchaeote SCGC RSA3]|uniref:Ig family protein n=2 Tax=Marine Group I TaxID=905826 RepID=A0A087RT49_9ARCH|nr:Ig family protein [Marine Group I thaumarchaeote SCGC AAA799-D11]KFM18706.1 hypothetical protein SCCGRSA3_01039 [Marine Group I thaumarchaeote SCGC RSA3]